MSNFFATIADAGRRGPGRTAIEVQRPDGVETTTYAELLAEAARVSGWLAAEGIAPGDRVAILADNDARWIARYLGILHRGAVAVPLDTSYKTGQVRTVVDNSGARLLFTSVRYADTARAALAGSTCRGALLSGEAPDLPGPEAIDRAAAAADVAACAGDTAAVILYTSGTTSDPKGVVLTHANLAAEQHAAFQVVDVTEDDAVLGVLPLFHALAQMANLLLPLSVGARVVFLESVNSTALLEALQARGITIFACVPQFFYLIHTRVAGEVSKKGVVARALFRALVGGNAWLRDRTGANPGKRIFARVHRVLGSRMRILVTGGSRFDPAIGRDLYGLGFTLLNAYGLTETSGGATIVRPGDRFTTSVGQPFPGVEIKVSSPRASSPETAHDAGEHVDGEILIRGPIVMREYYRRPDATAEVFEDGWFRTGDLGRLDEAGRLHITGRLKEVIVLASGKNLYPEEIEAHYRQAPVVKELCVLGISPPGEPAAERLHAVVVPDEAVLRARGVVNVGELVRFELEGLSVQLPPHKRILSYDVSLEPLPRTTTGKVRRHEVERRLAERATTPVADARPLTDEDRAWLADEAHERATAFVAARLGRPAVHPHDNLELDLGLDSMERVELLTALERRAGTRVAPEVRATIFTVRQVVEAVRAAPAGLTAAVPDSDDRLAWDVVLTESPDEALVQHLGKAKIGRAVVLFVLIRTLAVMIRPVVRFRTAGQDRLPATGPCIISPNHQTYLDAFFVAARLPFGLFRRVFLVGAAEYFERPAMAWLARAVNIVPVDPNANLVTAMRAGAAGLRLGKVLILFPEGERSIDGEIKTFRKGAAILASHLDAPIVPVAIDGLFPLWPRGRTLDWRRLRPGATRVALVFGAPVTVARGAYEAGTTTLRAAVDRLFAGLRAAAR
ncbi:MAG TPA: AMP-binding protein [Vicinamibacterales bacterium]|nr:AMP-binding protein [Vicinamibacterales bacterium]